MQTSLSQGRVLVANSCRRSAYRWLGALLVFMGVHQHFFPDLSRPTGRWAWLFGAIWDAGGNTGLVVYWIAIGLGFLVFSLGGMLRRI